MKKGTLNCPCSTLLRNKCKVDPSNGNAPITNTYNTTPKLWKIKKESNKSIWWSCFSSRLNQLKTIKMVVPSWGIPHPQDLIVMIKLQKPELVLLSPTVGTNGRTNNSLTCYASKFTRIHWSSPKQTYRLRENLCENRVLRFSQIWISSL